MATKRQNKRMLKKHKGNPNLAKCPLCETVVLNDSPFPFHLCTGPPEEPHKPYACLRIS